MAGEQLSIRIQPAVAKRVDSLRAKLAKDPNLSAALGQVTRTTVAKLAFMRGLEVLEREYSAK